MTVKSQDDLNKPETHSTEVLLSTIEELERTKKQLEIAVGYFEWIKDTTKKGHVCCDACGYEIPCKGCENGDWAEMALHEIEELEK